MENKKRVNEVNGKRNFLEEVFVWVLIVLGVGGGILLILRMIGII